MRPGDFDAYLRVLDFLQVELHKYMVGIAVEGEEVPEVSNIQYQGNFVEFDIAYDGGNVEAQLPIADILNIEDTISKYHVDREEQRVASRAKALLEQSDYAAHEIRVAHRLLTTAYPKGIPKNKEDL